MKKDKLWFLRHLAVLVLVLVSVLCLTGVTGRASEDDEENYENEYEQFETESNDTIGTANVLTVNYANFDEQYVMNGDLDYDDAKDWYYFDLLAGSNVEFTMAYWDTDEENTSVLWSLTLCDASQATIGKGNYYHESMPNYTGFNMYLAAGRYYARVDFNTHTEGKKADYFLYVNSDYRIVTSIASAKVSGIVNKPYTGKSITQSVVVKLGDKTLVKGTDYTVTYKNNVNVGTATMTIKGIGDYKGTITKTFKITRRSISSAAVTGITSKVYAGVPVTMTKSIVVTLGGRTLTRGTDYTVAYQNNTSAGIATVVITGKVNYTGKITKTFKISPGSGLITAAATKYSAATGSANTGKFKEGTAAKLYQKQGARWRVQANGTYSWVDEHYVFNLATKAPKASDRIGQGVTTKEVKVYESPAAKGTPISTLKAGVTRNLYAQSGNWYQIYTGGKYAWVRVDGFDYTQALSSKPIKQIVAIGNLQTYYGPGTDYEKSIVIPNGKLINVYKQEGEWSLVYRTGKYLWVKQTD